MKTTFVVLATLLAGCGAGEAEVPDTGSERSQTGAPLAVPEACGGAKGVAQVGWLEAKRVAERESSSGAGRIHLAIGLRDDRIGARVPGYDGASERAFACVPLQASLAAGAPTHLKIPLQWERSEHGVDVHRAVLACDTAWSCTTALNLDVSNWQANRRGAYFGLETSAGLVWAQWPGDDVSLRTVAPGTFTTSPTP